METELIDARELDIPALIRGLENLSRQIDKAAAYAHEQGIDGNEYVQTRLAPDMLNLAGQVQRASDTAKFGGARLSQGQAPSFADEEATLDDLKKLKLGHWDLDEIGLRIDHAIGLTSIPIPPDKVNPALEAKQLEGLATTPTVVLGFQMMPHLRYYLDLKTNYFYGCVVVSNRSFDRVSTEDQVTLRAAAAKFRARIEQVGKQQDDELLGGLFAQKGIKPLPVSAALRNEYLVAARQARELLGDKLGVPAATLQRVLALLADFRAARTN